MTFRLPASATSHLTHSSTSSNPLAGYEARLYACAIDMLFLGFISLFLHIYQNGLLLFLLQGVYFISCWHSFQGKTLGNKIMRIRVVTMSGDAMTWKQSTLRFIGFILSEIVFFVGFLWIFWNKQRRGWHDLFSGTIVIKS